MPGQTPGGLILRKPPRVYCKFTVCADFLKWRTLTLRQQMSNGAVEQVSPMKRGLKAISDDWRVSAVRFAAHGGTPCFGGASGTGCPGSASIGSPTATYRPAVSFIRILKSGFMR